MAPPRKTKSVTTPPATPNKPAVSTLTPKISPKAQSFFVNRLYNLHERYELDDNATYLLKALDDAKAGRADLDAIARFVRLSSHQRKSLSDTITKCTEVANQKPEEAVYCLSLITKSNELLKLAGMRCSPSLPPLSLSSSDLLLSIIVALVLGQYPIIVGNVLRQYSRWPTRKAWLSIPEITHRNPRSNSQTLVWQYNRAHPPGLSCHSFAHHLSFRRLPC